MDAWAEELRVTEDAISAGDVFVDDLDGRPVGVVSLASDELGLLFVEPEMTGCGHGRRLFRFAVTEARARGAERLVIASDPGAEGFYVRMGATRTGERASTTIPGRSLPVLEMDTGRSLDRGANIDP